MAWLVRYTFDPDRAQEFAWDEGRMTYEECVDTLDDVFQFLYDFPDAVSSFSCVRSACSQPNLDPQTDLSSTTSRVQCADSTTVKSYPGLVALLYGEENSLAGIVLGAVLCLILLALAILAIQFT